MGGMRPGMHEHDGDRGEAPLMRGGKAGGHGSAVQRRDLRALGIQPGGDLQHCRLERRGLPDIEVEEPGARLIADAQQIPQAVIRHQ